ncbi:MAG: Fe-S cluster assembly scaffold protein NifU [Clostridia bacterium]|nr:Fe-S cluster assembly scaffold protein NifU [Clostridia bacterium]
MYNEKVMEIFSNPKNVGQIENANGVGTVGNASCGDIMKLYLLIKDNIIEDAKFETFGCAAAIVSSSVATEMIKGKTIEEALELKNSDIIDYLGGLPAQKIHCSVLAKEALEEAISNYKENLEK